MQLTKLQREQIEKLAEVMDAYNRIPELQHLCGQDQVYGAVSKAIDLIVADAAGKDVAHYIACSADGYNWHGNACFADDVQSAIDDARAELAADARAELDA